MWVWCETAEGPMDFAPNGRGVNVGMVWNGRGVNGYGVKRSRGRCRYGVKRSRGQWVVYETVELSTWRGQGVWCDTAEGSMSMV